MRWEVLQNFCRLPDYKCPRHLCYMWPVSQSLRQHLLHFAMFSKKLPSCCKRYFSLIFLLVLLKHHDQKQFEKERAYFILQLLGHIHHWEKTVGAQGRNLLAGTEAEIMGTMLLPTWSSWPAQPPIINNPGLPAQGWYHPQLVRPSHINH